MNLDMKKGLFLLVVSIFVVTIFYAYFNSKNNLIKKLQYNQISKNTVTGNSILGEKIKLTGIDNDKISDEIRLKSLYNKYFIKRDLGFYYIDCKKTFKTIYYIKKCEQLKLEDIKRNCYNKAYFRGLSLAQIISGAKFNYINVDLQKISCKRKISYDEEENNMDPNIFCRRVYLYEYNGSIESLHRGGINLTSNILNNIKETAEKKEEECYKYFYLKEYNHKCDFIKDTGIKERCNKGRGKLTDTNFNYNGRKINLDFK